MKQDQFVAELSKLRPSSTFMSLLGYRNAFSEVADYSLVFHISYRNALQRSLIALEQVIPDTDYDRIAKQELQTSYQASLDKLEEFPMEELQDHYTHFKDDNGQYIRGVKLHTATHTLHLYGLISQKRVLTPGIYPPDTRRPLTKAKDKMRQLCPVNRFRQFKVTPDQVDKISVEHLSLLPPDIQ
jgi:hypothetical protein